MWGRYGVGPSCRQTFSWLVAQGEVAHPVSEPYRSRDDPLFTEAMDEISAVLRPALRSRPASEVGQFFQYQMAYLLLWSALERFCSLRYGLGLESMARIHRLAEEPAFSDALKRHVHEERRVFRADRPTEPPEHLRPDDPTGSLDFYHQARSNIVHRGKSVRDDLSLVQQSLAELSAIFRDLLDSVLGERRSY
jgi:hypothetical protein